MATTAQNQYYANPLTAAQTTSGNTKLNPVSGAPKASESNYQSGSGSGGAQSGSAKGGDGSWLSLGLSLASDLSDKTSFGAFKTVQNTYTTVSDKQNYLVIVLSVGALIIGAMLLKKQGVL